MKKPFYIIMLVVAFAGLGLQAWYYLLKPMPEPGLSTQSLTKEGRMATFSTVPAFRLTDRSGNAVSNEDLRGKVWLANFIYTTCPSTCPMLSSRFSALQEKAFAAGDVRFVSFSVDPTNDTPTVMKEYADALGAKPNWYFLTGGDEELRKVAIDGFLMGYQKVPDKEEDIIHSGKIALVDRKGNVRRFYDGVEKDESVQILADLQTLLKEE